MTFSVGDTVVYPHHGAALIESIEMREIGGQERKYLVLRVAQGAAPALHRGADQLVAPV